MPDILDRLKTALADRYAIEEELGAGGMATVYLAEDLKLHRKVAVKVLRPELAAALGPERFLREIEIAAKLHHPHILALHDSGEADGFLYYVMPYVEGESLPAIPEHGPALGPNGRPGQPSRGLGQCGGHTDRCGWLLELTPFRGQVWFLLRS